MGLAGVVARLEETAAELAHLEARGEPSGVLTDVVEALSRVEARVEALRAKVIAAVEADGTWTLDGSRSLQGWVRRRSGRSAPEVSATIGLARALRDHLPQTAVALTAGEISVDHARVLARQATKTAACREMLSHPELGEAFLLDQAHTWDATVFHRVVKHWALRADPEAADRSWREDAGKEQFSLARTLDGWSGRLWLSEVNGALLNEALQAWSGTPAVADLRTPGQRRAAALVEVAGAVLDSGRVQASARIRPHLAITADVTTLNALLEAQRSPERDGGDRGTADDHGSSFGSGGSFDDRNGPGPGGAVVEDEVLERITAALDYAQLVGVEPAALGDGTPLPFSVFAQLVCESHVHRVLFSAAGEVLDVGRQARLFTPAQTRGVLARDVSCRFPRCTAPPGAGEVHHALHYASGGDTEIGNGVLLCRYHHSLVHRLGLTIEREETRWVFRRPAGELYGTTPIERASLAVSATWSPRRPGSNQPRRHGTRPPQRAPNPVG